MGRALDSQQTSPGGVSLSQPPAAELLITRGLASLRKRRIDAAVFTLGSGSDCDLILGDEQFPEFYAYILFNHGQYQIRCLTPEPVLTLNAEDTIAARLSDGDRLRCGPYEFRFQQIAASPNRPASSVPVPSISASAHWVVTDGQSTEGVAAVRRLLFEIQARVESARRQSAQNRRSA